MTAKLVQIIAIVMVLAFFESTSFATDSRTRSYNKVQNNLPSDRAVRADPKPKPNPVGQPVTDYHPAVKISKPLDKTVVPRIAPNPRKDPAVQKGIDSYRRPGS
jgi:hypothetical protein